MQAAPPLTATFIPIFPCDAVFLPARAPQRRLSIIPACHSLSNSAEPAYPPDWVPCTHPNGATYYYSGDLHVVTYSNPSSLQDLEILISAQRSIFPKIVAEVAGIPQPDRLDLLLHVMPGAHVVGYCGIDHGYRNVVWVQDEEPQRLDGMAFHTGLARTAQYWSFVKQFPCHRPVELSIRELVGVLSHGAISEMTIPDSIFPFEAVKCRSMLELMRSEPDYSQFDHTVHQYTWSAAIIWEAIEQHRDFVGRRAYEPLLRMPLFGRQGIAWFGPHPSVLYVPPLLFPIPWATQLMLWLQQYWNLHKIALLLGNTVLLLFRSARKELSCVHCCAFIVVLALLSRYMKHHSAVLCRALNLGDAVLGPLLLHCVLALDATLLAGTLYEGAEDMVIILLTIATFTWIFVQHQGIL